MLSAVPCREGFNTMGADPIPDATMNAVIEPLLPSGDAPAPPWPSHSMQMYDDEASLLEEVSRWVGEALGRGDAVIVLATDAHREGIAGRLHARGFDLAQVERQGRYLVRDAAATLRSCATEGWPDAARFTDVVGGLIRQAGTDAAGASRRVAVYGELVALLVAEGRYDAAIRLESLWNELAGTYTFALHCAYPLGAFPREADGDALHRICAAHTGVRPLASYMNLPEEDDRLRAVALLQQQAQSLAVEVAERQRVDQELLDRNRELQSAVAARDMFLAVAGHELKTPLTSLRGYTQLLLRDLRRGYEIAPDRLARSLNAIEGQTGKINQLVGRLLDTAQVEAGKLRLEPVPIDLVPLIQAVVAHLQSTSRHVVAYDGPARLTAIVDPLRFEQVVTNLTDNAVKYSPVGSLVTVALGADEASGIRLSVTDEGSGIPPEQRAAIFSPFEQGNERGPLSGMGLGLYISRQIIELHGGTIAIEDREHAGACFVVTLPPMNGGAPSPAAEWRAATS
jgi:signal transduction histidine kinase